jgi:RNA polymerase sigma-70 factor, ECF subfamily
MDRLNRKVFVAISTLRRMAALMDPAQTDENIARGLRAGQTDAWQALYDAYARLVWAAVARQMGPAATEVADVVQETFLAAARSARQYDPARGSLGMWLFGIARRHVALHFRRQQRHDRVGQPAESLAALGQAMVQQIESPAPGPGDVLAQSEMAGLVRTVLTELPVDYETLLAAKYFHGVSVEDLAGQEESSATAVRSKLARARRAFRVAFLKKVTV